MPMDLPPYNYSNADDQNLPPVYEGQRFMPASPAEVDQFNPNVGDKAAQQAWLQDEVYSKGWTVDGLTGEIYDPDTDTIKGVMPQFYPKT